MSIKIVHVIRHHEGRPDESRPMFFCDHCDRPIEEAGLRLYVFPDQNLDDPEIHDGTKPVPLFTVHKGNCDEQFHLDRDFDPRGVPTMEISVLPIMLGNNMNLDWDDAQRRGGLDFS